MPAVAPAVSTPAVLEFDRQAAHWAAVGHAVPAAVLAGLRERLPNGDPTRERVPFVLVVPSAVTPAAAAMARTALRGQPGTVNQHAADIDSFAPIPEVGDVSAAAYLLLDVERGSEFCGTPPEPALATLTARGRTPLTVAEGIALVTLHPELLEKNHCFSLAGSRRGDRRVPALWISHGAPHLGWCFAGAPHSWLGLASATGRVPG